MPIEEIIEVYLNSTAGAVKILSGFISSSSDADFTMKAVVLLMNTEEQAENNIESLEMTYYAPKLVKECRSSLLESNRVVTAHLEKFQLHGYHFEDLIHALKLENETLSEENHFA
ncbi:MAG: hypothetical protein IJ642_12085 [Oscillospiraceae bacterium]|nr:hypothetical protein [Oscillospiraceae bacterium]